MCSNQTHRYNRRRGKRETSERMKFYRHLRSFIIFNLVMAGLWLTGNDFADIWGIGRIWGVFLAIHYIKVNGIPATKGWLSKDWEAWMQERESQHWEDEPETIVDEPLREPMPRWKEKDLV